MPQRFADRLRLVIGDEDWTPWALRHGIAPSTVEGWLNKGLNPYKKSLEKLERATGIPVEWWLHGKGQPPTPAREMAAPYMQEPHYGKGPASVDTKVLAQVLAGLDKALKRAGKDLPPDKKSELVAVLYEHVLQAGVVDFAFIERVMKLAM